MSTRLIFVTGNAGKMREVRQCLPESITIDTVSLDLPELQCATVQEVSRHKAHEAYRRVMASSRTRTTQTHGTEYTEEMRTWAEDGGDGCTDVAVLVEDTSLELEALQGLPGPYVKWFLNRLGAEGLVHLTEGFDTVPEKEGEHGQEQQQQQSTREQRTRSEWPRSGGERERRRRATARCVFSLCRSVDGAVEQYEGVCHGYVVCPARGRSGFGWDSIFVPDAVNNRDNTYDNHDEKEGDGEAASVCLPRTFAEMTAEEKNAVSHRARALDKLRRALDS